MSVMKENNRIILEASSPKQLKESFKESLAGIKTKPRVVSVSISEQKVMMRPFYVNSGAQKQIEHQLLGEIVEIMALTPNDVVFDYEITKSEENSVHGVYMCIPKSLFEEYLQALGKKQVNPVKITERFLVNIDWLCQQGKLTGKRICFLDFSIPKIVGVFISNSKKCELLRKIHYEGYDEAQREIIQSLRSASANSKAKEYDMVYCHGEMDGMDKIVGFLKSQFHEKVEEISFINQKEAMIRKDGYFRLNFISKYSFSQKQIRIIYAGVNIVFALCFMLSALMGLQMLKKNLEINRVKEKYQEKEYEYAFDLSNKLKK